MPYCVLSHIEFILHLIHIRKETKIKVLLIYTLQLLSCGMLYCAQYKTVSPWITTALPPLPTGVKPQPHWSLVKNLALCPIPRGGKVCGNFAKWIVHIKSIAAKGTASQFIPSELNILSSGAEYSEEENEEEMLENFNKSSKQESTITEAKECTMNETRNKTVSEARNQFRV